MLLDNAFGRGLLSTNMFLSVINWDVHKDEGING